MKKTGMKDVLTPSQHIDTYIQNLSDWRGNMIARLRTLILETAPELTEEWKWDTPVWSYKGNVVAAGVFKDHVKLNFFKGASLNDPKGLFNAGLDAKATRAIDIAEGEAIDEPALKAAVTKLDARQPIQHASRALSCCGIPRLAPILNQRGNDVTRGFGIR